MMRMVRLINEVNLDEGGRGPYLCFCLTHTHSSLSLSLSLSFSLSLVHVCVRVILCVCACDFVCVCACVCVRACVRDEQGQGHAFPVRSANVETSLSRVVYLS